MAAAAADPSAALVARLAQPSRFPHPAGAIEIVETHISRIVLAGDYAYKLKKPLDLGFLDFSTLEKRHAACVDEVRLNRRLAPDLYLDVVAITGSADDPQLAGPGPALEYAVRMRRFDRTQELDRLLRAGRLDPARIDELAALVARFHAGLPAAPADLPYGTPQSALGSALANFAHALDLEHAPAVVARLTGLRQWTQDEFGRIAPALAARRALGFVRECHGDLHLANVVLHDGRVLVFDCIEFNPELRWIDVMSEIAFTAMDLRHRRRADLAQRFLNDYLEATGDYAGLAVLRFYLVYRAMVRAKVAAIRAAQEKDAAARERDEADFRAHLALAEDYARGPRAALVVTCGPSGCGKSFLAARLVPTGDWIRVRSDVERKRLAGLAATARTDSAVGGGLYADAMSERTYARLAELARAIVGAGYPVIVDATFLRRAPRAAFRALASDLRVPFAILAPQAPAELLRERVVARAKAGADPSEATLAVLERQLVQAEPLLADEEPRAVRCDASAAVDPAALAAAVAARLGR